MNTHLRSHNMLVIPLLVGLSCFGLYLTSLYSYLLFHSAAEIFSIVIACGVFMLAWNSRRFLDNDYFVVIGIAYLFVAVLDTIHFLAYSGMNVFIGYESDLPTQLWIAARYLQSVSLLLALFFIQRRSNPPVLFTVYAAITSVLVASIFYLDAFPTCYVEGIGLTPFKKISECIICLILGVSVIFILRKRREFDRGVLRLLIAGILVTIASESAFVFYFHVYAFANMLGHLLKIVSFYLIYRAIIYTSLRKPYSVLFRNLKQSQEALVFAKREAERANRAKSEFLSHMSHELRTPMSAILGFSQLLQTDLSEPLTESQQRSIDHVLKAGLHLLELIDEILDLSRIESGKLMLSMEAVEVGLVVLEALSFVMPMAKQRKIRIENETTAYQESCVTTDRTRFKQVLINLLSNAVKYNKEDGVVTISCKTVFGDRLRISVSDTGSGIPSDKLEAIFEPYNRLDADRSAVKGTGIGLLIAKRLMELMGGTIEVESVLGEGTRFHIELPIAEEGSERSAEQVTTPEMQRLDVSERRNIVLYIDDDLASIDFVTRFLSRWHNIDILSASEAKEGIDLACALSPDLILLDIDLPDMSGYETLKILQAHDDTKNTPVVAITASAMPQEIRKGLTAGFTEYLTKPIDINHLQKTIEHILRTDHTPGRSR
ncbi:MAG: MASE3 domain-containing protein [bacterium]